MSRLEYRVLFCVSVYTIFLVIGSPILCVTFFKYLQVEDAILATITLFMLSGLVFIVCYWLLQVNEPDNKDNLARDADAHADHIARKILVEELYKKLKSERY
jgi:hypothetical protein